jgi:hypothetical protein
MHVSFLKQANYGSGSTGAELAIPSGATTPLVLTVPTALNGMDAFRLVVSTESSATQTVYVLPATGDNRSSALRVAPGQVFETYTFNRDQVPRLYATGAVTAFVTFLGVGNEV